jgi:hypothetical protein
MKAWSGLLVVCALVGCSSGASVLTPVGKHATPTPIASHTGGSTATPTTAPSPSATSSAAIAAANAALLNIQTMYAALPHTNASADLSTLAAEMVSSGKFATAVVSPGGISATLPNGTTALVFGDRIGDTSDATTAQKKAARATGDTRRDFGSFSGKGETIAVFVNTSDTSGAFNPTNQATIASAIADAGFNNDHYGVDTADVELESFDNENQSGLTDVLDISTHGMVAVSNSDSPYYAWLSDTPLSGSELAKYAADYIAGNLQYAIALGAGRTPTFAFTPGFVTKHLTFRGGAIVINQSCYGQESSIASKVGATLKSAGVGRYVGWDHPVDGRYADQTDAFIWDRLLGEASPTLGQFVTQRTPAQRPFSLDDVQGVLSKETRSGSFLTSALTYAQSPPGGGYLAVNLVISDYGGETSATPPIEYALPSISFVSVTEDPTNPTLTINGKFPPQTGQVAVFDPSETEATNITPTSWTTSQIVVPIKASGVESKGLVVVYSDHNIQSNPVPLTQWTGTLSATENATWTSMNNKSGTGSGTTTTTFNVDFRADVHPTVPSIDASPVPQNLSFTNVESDSTGLLKTIMGSFTTADGMHSATLGPAANISPLTVGTPPLMNDFYLAATPGQPTNCNNAMPGPQTGPNNVFCPVLGFNTHAAGTCADNGGGLCTGIAWAAVGIIGAPSFANDGQVIFTMDPSTYAITVSSTSPNLPGILFEAMPQLTGNVTGTIGAPISPPAGKYPALRSHR